MTSSRPHIEDGAAGADARRLKRRGPRALQHRPLHRPGLIVADGFGGAVVRDAPVTPLAPARRKALTLAFARLGAMRTMRD